MAITNYMLGSVTIGLINLGIAPIRVDDISLYLRPHLSLLALLM